MRRAINTSGYSYLSVLCLLKALLHGVALAAPSSAPQPTLGPFYWPTPNKVFLGSPGLSLEKLVQPTVSGNPSSGLFGLVRNEGRRFHGGVDLKAVVRSSNGEAKDNIFAILEGRIAHINRVAGASAYGRYIVLEHEAADIPVYTLYAHLSSIDPALSVGQWVQGGQALGVMGRSSSVATIPKERAHLHFEIGLRLSDGPFIKWYQQQGFKSPNKHGVWNGLNLVGFDPLAFFDAMQKGSVASIAQYIQQLPTAFKLIVITSARVEFVRHYPSLVKELQPNREPRGWEVEYTWFGLPKCWTPIYDIERFPPGCNVFILPLHEQGMELARKRHYLAKSRRNQWIAGRNLKKQLALLFGL